MNKIILLGRLGKDPEVRVSQSGTKVASFSLGVNRRYSKDGNQESDWFNCVAFDKRADFVDTYLKKGTKILLSGTVQNDNYTSKDGNKVYSVKVIIDEIEFAESKGSSDNKPSERPSDNGWMNVPDVIDEELPFN